MGESGTNQDDRRAAARVGIAGLGSIGRVLAARVGGIPGYALAAVSTRRGEEARAFLDANGIDAPVVPLGELPQHADVVIDATPVASFRSVAEPALRAGRDLVPLSVGGLLENWDLVALARESGGAILVPSGAIGGLDGVLAAAEGKIESVRIITRKPVAGLLGGTADPGEDATGGAGEDREAALLFEGSVREAFARFPANLNTAVALSLAGIGPDRTRIEVWADPALTSNTHQILVVSDSVRLELRVENVPSENPRTSTLAALSVLALLRKRGSSVRVGS
ncbi:aspartate dehydrogenase [Microbacteriaceae bacterium 4G12]